MGDPSSTAAIGAIPMRSLLATRSCNTAAVMRRPGDDFLDSHPGFALTLLIVLTLLMVFALAMTVRWHRDREAYLNLDPPMSSGG